MDEITDFEKEQKEIQEEFLNYQIEEGKLVEGKVVLVQDGYVFIDINWKSEPSILAKEFDELPAIGDKITVFVEKLENRHGEIVVSKVKADEILFRKNLKKSTEYKQPVEGKFVKEVNGGLEVKLKGDQKAFCPFSQIDIFKVTNAADWIDKKANFLIEKVDRTGKNIIVSRRSFIEDDIEKKRQKFLAEKKVGDVVEGTVKNFTSYGAFIDLGGFDGLLHLSDLSWGHINSPRNIIEKNQTIQLKIVKIDEETKKINLSLKDLKPNPWENIKDKLQVEQIIKGSVSKIADFGIFVELMEGIEGLAHISELSWVKRIKNPKELFSVGDEVQVVVLDIDYENRKISLGVKQLLPNIWETFEEKYPLGSKVEGRVTNIIKNGVFIELEEHLEGFLFMDNISWDKKPINLKEKFKIDDKVDVCVLSYSSETKKISLGIKQLSENPWQSFSSKYRKNSIVEGEVTKVIEKGLLVKIENSEFEGFVPMSHLLEKNSYQDISDLKAELAKYKEGQKVKVAIYDINPKEKKLILSISMINFIQQRAEMSKYLEDGKDDNYSTSSLADFIKDK